MHSGAFLLETAIFAALENHSLANVLIPTMAGFDARSKAASKQRCCNAAMLQSVACSRRSKCDARLALRADVRRLSSSASCPALPSARTRR
jgi:hypothetical protein